MNQRNKYSDEYNYGECFTDMLLENQDSKSFALKHRSSANSNDGEPL